jgi:signal transduction histidine kinase
MKDEQKSQQIDILKDHRKNTDNSLKFERNKTDNYLDNESQIVEDESDEIVSKNRREADEKLKESRVREDSSRTLQDHSTPLLDAERKRSDLAMNTARTKEDKIRNEERDQKKHIAHVLLNTERSDTDNNLLCEREGSDEVSQNSSVLITSAQEALSTRDTYLGILSHDLKNPLSAISLSTNAIKRALEKDDIDKKIINKYFEAVERNVSSMGRMIDDLLDVEQMVNGDLKLNLKKWDLNAIVAQCKELFEPIAEKKLFTIDIIPSETAAIALIDHDRILQVLSNLVGNAAKYASENGVITLSVQKNEDAIVVSVKDEGPGIPIEKLDIIFERFTQLSGNERKGAGLGLFISKWIVESHCGNIFVESSVGKGSTFFFTLPC